MKLQFGAAFELRNLPKALDTQRKEGGPRVYIPRDERRAKLALEDEKRFSENTHHGRDIYFQEKVSAALLQKMRFDDPNRIHPLPELGEAAQKWLEIIDGNAKLGKADIRAVGLNVYLALTGKDAWYSRLLQRQMTKLRDTNARDFVQNAFHYARRMSPSEFQEFVPRMIADNLPNIERDLGKEGAEKHLQLLEWLMGLGKKA